MLVVGSSEAPHTKLQKIAWSGFELAIKKGLKELKQIST